MHFSGVLTDEGGELSIKAYGEWETTLESGVHGWEGTIQSLHSGQGLPVSHHWLKLDDGKRGAIRILQLHDS